MDNKNKEEHLLENTVNENSKPVNNIDYYTVRAAPAYQMIFDEIEKAKEDPEKSKQLAAAYLKRTTFDLGNVLLFVNKLDNVAFKGQTDFDKGFKEICFTFKYDISSNNPKSKINKVQDQKEKTVPLTKDEIEKLPLVDDDQFSRDMALKEENLDGLVGKTREYLNNQEVNVNLKYSFTEIHYTRDYKEFADINYDESKQNVSKNTNSIVSRIIIRQKKGMRFRSKAEAKETGLDKVSSNIYKRVCEERCNYSLDSEILNPKRKRDLIENITKYLNNLLSHKDEYYKRKILEKFGNINITPLKKLGKKNLNETVNQIYNFLKENPEHTINNTNENQNVLMPQKREKLFNMIKNFKSLNINKKNNEKIVNYITECFFPIRTKENNTNSFKPTLEDLIYPHLNVMLGTGIKGTEVNYDFMKGIKESKTDRIESKYEKLDGDGETRICDRFGFKVLCARESDIRKIIKIICSHFGNKVYDSYVTNKKFDVESLKKGIKDNRNMIIEIKDYTVKTKLNNFCSINGKMFYGGIKGKNMKPEHYLTPYIDYTQPTLIEFQIMTEKMYKNSTEGDASHNTMRFLQSLAIDVRHHNNHNNPSEIKRYDNLQKRYLYVQ